MLSSYQTPWLMELTLIQTLFMSMEGLSPDFEHALEHDQNEFNELFQYILSSFCSQTGCAVLSGPGLQALTALIAGGCWPLAKHV